MKFLILVALFFVFIPVSTVDAAGISELICEGTSCSACNVVDIANKGIIWLFGAVFLIFVYIMMVSGFGLITSAGNTSALEGAKSKFKNGIIGLLIIMSAWIFVDTIMRSIVGGGSGEGVSNAPIGEIEGWGPWSEVQCQTQTPTYNPPAAVGGVTPVDPGAVPVIGNGEARSTLASNGITVNKGECPAGVRYQDHPGGCTSVEGLNPGAIQGLIHLRNECGTACPAFTVTGGSELGHSGSGPGTHAGGDKFDLRTSDVNSYIMGPNFRDGNQGSRQGRVNISSGVACVREGVNTSNDHWDCRS